MILRRFIAIPGETLEIFRTRETYFRWRNELENFNIANIFDKYWDRWLPNQHKLMHSLSTHNTFRVAQRWLKIKLFYLEFIHCWFIEQLFILNCWYIVCRKITTEIMVVWFEWPHVLTSWPFNQAQQNNTDNSRLF